MWRRSGGSPGDAEGLLAEEVGIDVRRQSMFILAPSMKSLHSLSLVPSAGCWSPIFFSPVGCSVHGRMFGDIADLHPLNACSNLSPGAMTRECLQTLSNVP